jgi:hypothetical protein
MPILLGRAYRETYESDASKRARIIVRLGFLLGEGDGILLVDEFSELPVGAQAANTDVMDRRFFQIVLIRSHAERAARNPYNIRQRRLLGLLD